MPWYCRALQEAFGTTDEEKICLEILSKGELQVCVCACVDLTPWQLKTCLMLTPAVDLQLHAVQQSLCHARAITVLQASGHNTQLGPV